MKLVYLLYIISGSFKKLNETKLIQRIEDRSQIKSRNEVKLHQEILNRRLICQSTPSVDQCQKSVEIQTLCQLTPFKNILNNCIEQRYMLNNA